MASSGSRLLDEFLGEYAARQLWWFLGAVFLFHTSEFLLACAFHGRQVTLSSLLLSREYLMALLCALLEHSLESRFLPDLKSLVWISHVGLVLMVAGELIRKAAILTATTNFTHDIKEHRRDNHELVTSGVYSFVRHPGYLGFFLWSVATQVLLINPVCILAYAWVTWRFFQARIAYEEWFLRRFFGAQYERYAERVPSGIPFVH